MPFASKAPNVRVDSLTPRTSPYRNDKHHAIAVTLSGVTDIWITQREQVKPKTIEIRHAESTIRTDAAAVHVSLKRKKVVKVFRVGGTYVEVNGRRVSGKAHRLDWYARVFAPA